MSQDLLSLLTGQMMRLLGWLAETAEDPWALGKLLAPLDATDPRLSGGFVQGLRDLAQGVAELEAAEGTQPGLQELGEVLDGLRRLAQAAHALGSSSVLDAEQVGEDLLNLTALTWLRGHSPIAYQIAVALGVVAREQLSPIMQSDEYVRIPQPVERLVLKDLGALLDDPFVRLRADLPSPPLANAANTAETADILVDRFGGLLNAMGIRWAYGYPPEHERFLGDAAEVGNHTLAIYLPSSLTGEEVTAGVGVTLSAADAGDLGVVLTPIGELTIQTSVGRWNVTLAFDAAVQALALGGGQGPQILAEVAAATLEASFSAVRTPPPAGGPAAVIGAADATHLELGAPSASAKLAVHEGGFDVALGFETGASAFVLDPGDADGFLAELLPAGGLRTTFDFGIAWSHSRGFAFNGGAGLDAALPVSLSLSGLTVTAIHMGLRAADGAVEAEVSLSLKATIGPVTVLLDRIGLNADLASTSGGSLGVADLDFAFRPPNGVGLEVEAAGIVTGGGFLFHDPARSLYFGDLQLTLHDQLTVKAFGLITAGGEAGFSLVVFLTVEDFTPIQLGLGFKLTGIGGMLGVHRTFDEAAIREGLKSDGLAALLFPKDPVADAPAVLQALSTAFPAQRGHYVLGLLAQIEWPTPTLVRADLGLFLEFGGRSRLMVLGRVSCLLPSPDNDLVRLNLDTMGVLDFDQGALALDAVLVDSRLAHRFPLTGAMALRARLHAGPGSGFIMAVGGLNPRFAPPEGLPQLPRIAIALSSGDNPRLTCEAYFAITANTVQYGARAQLYAAAYDFSLQGDVGYDVLVEIAPLHFAADFHAQVQLKHGDSNLFKVSVDGALEGPRPLKVSGKASFEIFWCDFSIRFDKALVEGDPPPPLPAIDVAGALKAALLAPESWSTEAGQGAHGVALRKADGGGLALDPGGRLAVRQLVAPLNAGRDIDLFGGAPVAGARRFELAAALNGRPQAADPLQDQFAPAQLFAMSDDEKLAAPSFETMQAGLVFGEAVAFDADEIVAAPLAYETSTFDDQAAPPAPETPAYGLSAAKLAALAQTGAAGRAAPRRLGAARFVDDAALPAARITPLSWAIVPLADGDSAIPPNNARTWTELRAALASLNQGRARWQMTPTFELAM